MSILSSIIRCGLPSSELASSNLDNSDVVSAKSSSRLSNIELLRIIAMILVVVVHCDFYSLGAPTVGDYQSNPLSTITRVFVQAIAICCVNVFVLISGYFGIRQKSKSLVSFVYQILFISIFLYTCCILSGISSLNLTGIFECLCLTKANWFVKAYLLLFILAPVLNAFVELKNRKLHRNILIYFFLMQTVYGCLHAVSFFEDGYSTLSFIGLYLLGRYIYIYCPKFSSFKAKYDIMVYLLCVICLTILSILMIRRNMGVYLSLFAYINPLVIIESLALLLFFGKFKFQSKVINWIATSAFTVYLFHMYPTVLAYFKECAIQIYSHTSGISTLLYMGVFVLAVFVISVLLDQIRKYSYSSIIKVIRKYHNPTFLN